MKVIEDFVPFQMAIKLKEKGLILSKEYIFGAYDEDGDLFSMLEYDVEEYWCAYAPTIAQSLKWLREEKNISVQPLSTRGNLWESQITFTNENDKKLVEQFLDGSFWAGRRSKTYEEAALAGIQYVIDNLI